MYNPFDKPVEQIEEHDLRETLRGKAEAWMFEYKGPDKMDDKAGIAKSIASFANKYGGWLFIGINADTDTNEPDAENIPGIPLQDHLTESIYQICNSHLSPAPYAVCHAVPLANDNCVLVIYVPESADPPHVHMQTGSIPVRSGNVTDPIDRIEDRAQLDRLYDKAKENRNHVEKLLERHRRGKIFLQSVRTECEELGKAIHPEKGCPPFGTYSMVSYPMSKLPQLFEFPLHSISPTQMLQEAAKKLCPIAMENLLDGLRNTIKLSWIDQYGLYEVSDGCELFYLDSFGHIGFAGIGSANRPHSLAWATVEACIEHLESFMELCEILYQDMGYWGRVRVDFCIHLEHIGYRGPVEIQAPAGSIVEDTNIDDIKAQLLRLARLWDES